VLLGKKWLPIRPPIMGGQKEKVFVVLVLFIFFLWTGFVFSGECG
jgi:hypothetical protein